MIILNAPLSICAWYGLIRTLCGKPFALPGKKPRRFNPIIMAVIFGVLSVFLLVMDLRARAEYFAALVDPAIEGHSGEHAVNWGRWSIVTMLSVECTIVFAIAGFRDWRKKRRSASQQKGN